MNVAGNLVKNIGFVVVGTAGVAVGAAADHVVVKKATDKIIQKEKISSFEAGVRKGIEIGTEESYRALVNPILAKIAFAYYIAKIDGKISKQEKVLLDDILKATLSNPELPSDIRKEIKIIISSKEITFNNVSNYLDKVSPAALKAILLDIYEIADASDGISEAEADGIAAFENYMLSREDLLIEEKGNDLDAVLEEKIQNAVSEYTIKMRMLDHLFSYRTKLNQSEINLLIVATALQCLRIYLMNYFTTIEKAGKGKRESSLHKQQDYILKHFDKGYAEKPHEYYAPLSQIISISGVPYDTTRFKGKRYDIFNGLEKGMGANHRFSTLGHDPFIGLVVGTANIMTNTITTVREDNPLPRTFHVNYTDTYKSPGISGEASFVIALKQIYERSKDDITPLVAALIKQLIHIATDTYTPAGIQLPGANLMLSRKNAEILTSYVSHGDMTKLGTSANLDLIIDKIIEILHGCLLLESDVDIDNKINLVKTKKILLYSQTIATGSNLIIETITGNIKNLDWAGFVLLINRLFSDVDFIYNVKYDFLRTGLGEI